MKKITAGMLLFLVCILSAMAHEPDMSNTQGLFGFSPEYIHTLINPLPTYGVAIGIGVLIVGLLTRSITTRNVGLVIILLCTGIAWAVVHYGQHAYNHLFPDLDAESKKWADLHMDRAESFAWDFYLTAVLSVIALAVPKTRLTQLPTPSPPQPQPMTVEKPTPAPTTPKSPTRTLSPIGTIFAVIVLISAIISFALGSWISKAGGRIRHTEFRDRPAPTHTAEPHEHHHD
jgi:hypothetical protein